MDSLVVKAAKKLSFAGGLDRGQHIKALQVSRRMKESGYSATDIHNYKNMPIEEIKAIRIYHYNGPIENED